MCEKDHVSCMRAKVNILKGRKGLGYKNTKCAQWAHSQLLALALVGYCQETAVAPTKNGIGIGPKIPLARMKCDTRRKRWDKQYILT